MEHDPTAIVLKVLVLGDAGTGKTSIIKQYVSNTFSGMHKATVGVDFHMKQLMVGDKLVKLQLWDIAGQERFGAMSRVYYKGAYGAMLVYDISRAKTFETVAKWKDEIDAKVSLPNGKPIPVVLLGNKCDLDVGETDTSQLEAFVKEHKFAGTFDTSAKLNIKIDKAARFLVEKILENEDLFVARPEQETTYQPGVLPKRFSRGACC